jgi:DUF1680 family protein
MPRPDIHAAAVGLALMAIPDASATNDAPQEIQAIPYFSWGNRSVGAMRVWIPRHSPEK